ncbi:hypothetical protein FGG08_003359 [Glutinoglossum americanum]|uniref:Coenzyme Q-binding protein COQ10 START domain-containing protein n=1 Tax=Glutinoglossum americanum TaxID=1670608 RepID=A0A9P8L3M2_9PEZI|nr:hypothetical protein FGG08_003359 [Glutinoglossum americanum]
MRHLRFLKLPPSSVSRTPLLNCHAWSPSKPGLLLPNHRRHFLPGLTPEVQTLHVKRTLPYPSAALYDIVADIDSYSAFLPYCLGSSVSRWTLPAAHSGKRWPTEAELRVGWGALDERFVSRVLCVPGSVVEAVSGYTQNTTSREGLPPATGPALSAASGLFTHLLTRWTIRPFLRKPLLRENGDFLPKEETEVNLDIEFQFANPIYSTLSKAVAPKVAGMMIEAFEERVKELLDAPATEAARSTTIGRTGDVVGKSYE